MGFLIPLGRSLKLTNVKWHCQVSLEDSPSEVFVHVSPARCWELVRERVNQEIAKQHKLGKLKLPPLQPPGSLDGMEMFGFSSPAIVQVIYLVTNVMLALNQMVCWRMTGVTN